MTDAEKLAIAQQSIKNLETRVIALEEQVATCLRWMRKQAELEVKKENPGFKPRETAKA